MGLNDCERKELDNMLKEIISQVNSFTASDVALYTSSNSNLKCLSSSSVNASSIRASLERLKVQYQAVYPSPVKYVFDHDPSKKSLHEIVKNIVVVSPYWGIKKEKNILKFVAQNMHMKDEFYYDFITKENNFSGYKMTVARSCRFSSFDDIIKLFDYEWIFNYADNFSQVAEIITELEEADLDPKVMPKNFLRYLEMNNGSYYEAIQRCAIDTKYPNYSAKERGFIFRCVMCKSLYEKTVDMLPPSQLLKVVENTICSETFGWTSYFRELVDVVDELKDEELDFTLDTNRTMRVNLHNAENLLVNHRNKELNAKLQKLNFINEHKLDGYIVIVPQNQGEKIDEGRQQNNCVGYYYDESILKGQNYIYFIRKIDSPDKSYLTCRFNMGSHATVEARYKNNVGISTKDKALIRAVDEIINLHINELR